MSFHILTPLFTGVAVADRAEGSVILNVRPMELLPNINGEINHEKQTITVKIKTPNGEVTRVIDLQGHVPATWLNKSANRLSAPDVRHGERVIVWQQGDSQNYYWEETDLDSHLRLTERIVIAISNTNPSDRTSKVLTKDNCYFFEIDTMDKLIQLTTNKNDGEPFAYNLTLNTKDGFYKSSDDVGNHVLMDSKNTVIQLKNKDLTEYTLDKENITEKCKGNYTREIGGNLVETVTGTSTRTVDGGETVNADVTIAKTLKVTKSINTKDYTGDSITTKTGTFSDSHGPH
jgi:hypothetical protein